MTRSWERTLEAALAAPALWDEGVEAARNACVAGAPLAAAAITAAAYYDNPLTGGRAMLAARARFAPLPLQIDAWLAALVPAAQPDAADAGDAPFVPGFGFVGTRAEAAVVATAGELYAITHGARLGFWRAHACAIRAVAGPLNLAGLCALLFLDAEVASDEAERRYLLLRLEPALAAAQRAQRAGLERFPFFENAYEYDGAWPSAPAPEPCSDQELAALKREVGID
jgi:hypothetical protein